MDGRVDAIGAADIENDILVSMKPGAGIEQLADHRLGHIGNHIIDGAKNRIIGTGVTHSINIVEYCLASINIVDRFRQYIPPIHLHYSEMDVAGLSVNYMPLARSGRFFKLMTRFGINLNARLTWSSPTSDNPLVRKR